jgi:very-short-patch-repair endonuclease
MIVGSYGPFRYTITGKINECCKRAFLINIVECDDCTFPYEEREDYSKKSMDNWGGHFCKQCKKKRNTANIVKAGRKALKEYREKDPELFKEHCSMAGKISANSPNNGRFTTERFQDMTIEERSLWGSRANAGLQKKLKDPALREEHFRKIYRNSRIGYMSTGQKELYNFLKSYGFSSEVQIGSYLIDTINEDSKIIVEYNGDCFHCNPKFYQENDYNSAIKMTSGEKWKLDRMRYSFLKRKGYKIWVVWEYDWYENNSDIKRKLLDYIGVGIHG